jgi:hypothetical protein
MVGLCQIGESHDAEGDTGKRAQWPDAVDPDDACREQGKPHRQPAVTEQDRHGASDRTDRADRVGGKRRFTEGLILAKARVDQAQRAGEQERQKQAVGAE